MSRVAITGALSYTGRYLSRLVLDEGGSVVNLSRRQKPIAAHTLRPEEVNSLMSSSLAFDDPAKLARTLEGVDVLVATYWIRFALRGDTHQAAADRCKILFEAAAAAGVRKTVFSSHTRADVNSPFAYIAGKARAVEALREVSERTGMHYAVVRPCGIFGDTADESILMNNAAWVIRRTPLFLLAGDGSHVFQPIHVRDMASLIAELGHRSPSSSGEERDACGPDAPTSYELFSKLGAECGSRSLVVCSRLPPAAVVAATKPIDWLTGDVLLDGDDMGLLCSGLTVADDPTDPAIAKRRSLFTWLAEQGRNLGHTYTSSVDRYYSNSEAASA